MIDEQEAREWEQLQLSSNILTSPHFGAWLYYRDKRRNKKVRAELLDKVMQKWRTVIDDDGVMYKIVLLKDIEDLKAEIEGKEQK